MQVTILNNKLYEEKNSWIAPYPLSPPSPPLTAMYNAPSSSPSSSLSLSLEPGVKSYPLFDFDTTDDSDD